MSREEVRLNEINEKILEIKNDLDYQESELIYTQNYINEYITEIKNLEEINMELFNRDDIDRLIATLDLIEEVSSRTQKEEYLKLLKDNETAKWFLYKTLSSDITFGVIPDIDGYNCRKCLW